MITFDKGDIRFSYRVAGVAIQDGKVLLQRRVEGGFFFLPGGRAELQESAAQTLRREMQEEVQADVTVERLLWVVENFFAHEGKTFHELGMYFLMSFPENSPVLDTNKTFFVQEAGHRFALQWLSLDALSTMPVYPSFLQTALQALPDTMEHIVQIDEK